jgi:hypothetical protein
MRVFVPATLPMLAELHQTARLLADGGIGYAVTPAMREWYADGDAEELEYAALTEAARASLPLLAADPTASRQRVVVAADVTGAVPDARHGRAAVRLTGPVGLAQVAALHVDGVDAAGTVQAAVEASDAATAGDADAAIAVAEPESFELLWFATQELPDLLQG